jgi:hypothetical protein
MLFTGNAVQDSVMGREKISTKYATYIVRTENCEHKQKNKNKHETTSTPETGRRKIS